MSIDKVQLRLEFQEKRNLLTETNIRVQSSKISSKIMGFHKFRDAQKILAYFPINREVDVKTLFDERFYVPSFLGNKWIVSKFDNFADIGKGPFGTFQPRDVKAVDIGEIEFAIVPGIAFGMDGSRLGYGKGVYDRLLRDSTCYKVGVCFDFQLQEDVPHDKHDLVMDIVVTEKRTVGV